MKGIILDKNKKTLLIYLRVGNKRVIRRINIIISTHHYCFLACNYAKGGCIRQCESLEKLPGLKKIVKDEFEIIQYKVTPLKVEKLNSKNYPL